MKEKQGPFLWVGEVDVLCGSKVMDDRVLFNDLKTEVKRTHRKIIGIEMEGEGAAAAAKASERAVEFILIKGVSDYAHEKSARSNRILATNNAVQFLLALLNELARGETP